MEIVGGAGEFFHEVSQLGLATRLRTCLLLSYLIGYTKR